jgi:hypothetical protein
MTELLIAKLKSIDDFESIKGLYNITIDKRDQLKFMQDSLQNIIVTLPENIDSYEKIKITCVEYLGIESPPNVTPISVSRNVSPSPKLPPLPESRNLSPLNPRNVPKPLGTSLNVISTGPLAQLKVRPPAPILAPVLAPPLTPLSTTSLPSTPASRSSSTPARTLLKGGPDRAPILRQPSTIPESVSTKPESVSTKPESVSTKPTIVVTDNFFNITINGITLTLKRSRDLSEEIIRKNIDLFSYYLNGIVINIDRNSRLAKMLYESIDKTNFETKTYTPPNNTENEYILLVPK